MPAKSSKSRPAECTFKTLLTADTLPAPSLYHQLIAMLSMLVDHLGVAFFPAAYWMRAVGRLAFPIFLYGVCYGAVHTRSFGKYLARLSIFALLSQPFYMLAFGASIGDGTLYHSPNAIVSLIFALLLYRSLSAKQLWYTLPLLVLLVLLPLDYGLDIAILVPLCYYTRQRPKAFALGNMGYWALYFAAGSVQGFALLAVPLLFWPALQSKRRLHWAVYAFYPLHLLLIYILGVAFAGFPSIL